MLLQDALPPPPTPPPCCLKCETFFFPFLAGEVMSVPLSRTVTSIWPLPFGLLLQQAAECSSQTYAPFSSSSPLLNARDIFCPKREVGYSPRHNLVIACASDHATMGYGAPVSSHMILKDPLEEPQVYM